ncbi:MAG: DNA polymerase IV [Candidatus Auribacter fodinae]|jgi:DNA polymerase-4|uniref:DNA polymerase IV n=1 Tax=Candidatus Auribacter fodinae TaxID=2093366 RepID=A0A3A4R063_9BACT|nr:MAG: DNA polymerase IV [Candidatus Auribacter fodinae]
MKRKSLSSANRVIAHVDMDAFFASVEQLVHPELRGKPVIVGAEPGKRGVVSAASYEARKFGIRSAMPISTAEKLCPHGIFLPVNGSLYHEYSRRFHDILDTFTPIVEPVSVDEAFLDLTGCIQLPEGLHEKGMVIKNAIRTSLCLTASVGIASNKSVAKIASDYNKPDGLCVVMPGTEAPFLAPMKVERLWGVGEKTVQHLHRHGIRTVSDLQKLTVQALEHLFGNFGIALHYLANGIDDRPVEAEPSVQKSIGKEVTFEQDTSDKRLLRTVLGKMAQEVGTRLREKNLLGARVTIKVRFKDFTTLTRCVSFTSLIDQDHLIFHHACELLDKVVLDKPVRLIGISVSTGAEGEEQMDFFHEKRDESRDLYKSIDSIRRKYGRNSVVLGNILDKPEAKS